MVASCVASYFEPWIFVQYKEILLSIASILVLLRCRSIVRVVEFWDRRLLFDRPVHARCMYGITYYMHAANKSAEEKSTSPLSLN